MPASLILGYGNPLRSDDGIGWKAAATIEQELASPELLVIAAHQLTPELADAVARCSRVLFLDAAQAGPPGEIRMERLCRDSQSQATAFTHQLSAPLLMELSYRLFGAEPNATLLTLAGECFDLGECFSPAVDKAWDTFLNKARAWAQAL